uniref:Uncharacterized protein n=1 Tax=Oryza rufipogon TaxID=4529 RepID=A0A0E0R1Z2_ORYRU
MDCGSDMIFCIICIITGFCNIWLKEEESGEPPSKLPKSAEPNPPRPPVAPVPVLPARPPNKLLRSADPNPPRPPVAPVLALPVEPARVAPCAPPAVNLSVKKQ